MLLSSHSDSIIQVFVPIFGLLVPPHIVASLHYSDPEEHFEDDSLATVHSDSIHLGCFSFKSIFKSLGYVDPTISD